MAVEKDRSWAHLEALGKLRRLIGADYQEGGWLPPNRVMCERCGVSYLTYCKALRRLVLDGSVRSYPRKGYCVLPALHRPRKVGLLQGDGGDSPFLYMAHDLAEAIRQLSEADFMLQLLQARTMAKLPGQALLHNVSGLYWHCPPRKARPVIKELNERGALPLVIAGLHDPLDADDALRFPGNYVEADLQQLGRLRAEFFISRGHRRVAYAGNTPWFAEHIGLGPALREAGIPFGPEDCVAAGDDVSGRLGALLAKGGFTGLSVDGDLAHDEAVLAAVAAQEAVKRPGLLFRLGASQLRSLIPKHPGVKLLGVERQDFGSVVEVATGMLLRNLAEGTPMSPRKLPVFRIDLDVEGFLHGQ